MTEPSCVGTIEVSLSIMARSVRWPKCGLKPGYFFARLVTMRIWPSPVLLGTISELIVQYLAASVNSTPTSCPLGNSVSSPFSTRDQHPEELWRAARARAPSRRPHRPSKAAVKSSMRSRMHGDRQRRADARPRAGRPPSCRCSRPDASARPGMSASRHASDHAGKAAAAAEIDPELRVRRQREQLRASRRRAGSRFRERGRRDEIRGLLPGGQRDRRSDRDAQLFHVKQGINRSARSRSAAGALMRVPRAGLAAHMRGQQRERRRRHAVDPAGLADGARPRGAASAAPRWRDR